MQPHSAIHANAHWGGPAIYLSARVKFPLHPAILSLAILLIFAIPLYIWWM